MKKGGRKRTHKESRPLNYGKEKALSPRERKGTINLRETLYINFHFGANGAREFQGCRVRDKLSGISSGKSKKSDRHAAVPQFSCRGKYAENFGSSARTFSWKYMRLTERGKSYSVAGFKCVLFSCATAWKIEEFSPRRTISIFAWKWQDDDDDLWEKKKKKKKNPCDFRRRDKRPSCETEVRRVEEC